MGGIVFRGVNPLSLDNKGRMAMPAKYRDSLQESCAGQLVVTIDPDRCLLIFPLPVWEEIEPRLAQLPSTHKQARALKRLLLGYAEDCPMDGSGRILLPAPLRSFAHMDKRVVLVGQGNRFELWDEQSWYQWREQALEDKDYQLPAESQLFSF